MSTASPPSTTIVLVRHGKTSTTGTVLPGRAPGLHLDPTGLAQAQRAAELIGDLKVAAIYTSPLERARETAKPIASVTGVKPVVSKGLIECDFGDWTGQQLKRLMKLPEWQIVQRAPSAFRFPNGESFPEMQTRMVSTLDALRLKHPGETIVCVSHADPIKAVLAHALGTHLDLFQRVVVSTCSISVLAWGAAGPIALAVNTTGRSLSELAPS